MNNLITKSAILFFAIAIISCTPKTQKATVEDSPEEVFVENLPAEGFDIEYSDPQAISIADNVMKAMGGRKAWDETRYISWDFFGYRQLLWDKWTGNVRIELQSNLKILMNINDMTGKVMKDGTELVNPDSVKHYLNRGNSIWINDSYWLVMPFKLKDSGVTLHYSREDTTLTGVECYVLQLSFKEVGDTPENMYDVWVDPSKNLVTQWSYYKDGNDSEPRFITPWDDYQKYGNILLSGNRGQRQLSDIKVLSEVPESAFSSFEDWTSQTN